MKLKQKKMPIAFFWKGFIHVRKKELETINDGNIQSEFTRKQRKLNTFL